MWPRVDFLPLTGLHKELELWYQQRPLAPICLLKECRRIWLSLSWFLGFPGASAGKESACNVGNLGLMPVLGRSPRRERLPTPVFWPREFHGLNSPWGHKELDMTEQLSLHFIPTSFIFFATSQHWVLWSTFTIDKMDSDSFRTDFHL